MDGSDIWVDPSPFVAVIDSYSYFIVIVIVIVIKV